MRLRDLENAANLAWPAPVRRTLDGFEFRRSAEASNRGNSVRRLGPDTSDLDEVIRRARVFYADAGKPAQFCVTDEMPIVDDEFDRRGFTLVDRCLYMVRSGDGAEPAPEDLGRGLVLTAETDLTEEWLMAWAACAELPEPERNGSFAVVASVASPCVYVCIRDRSDGVVSVGRAIDSGRWRGLHNLATRPAHRNRGLGKALMRALETAHGGDGQDFYLQVELNSPAVRLYERLGYSSPGGYHYRRDAIGSA